jgi:hypothetical protein
LFSATAVLLVLTVGPASAAIIPYTAWTVTMATNATSYGSYVAVDPSGNILIDGAANNSSFVAKYSPSGHLIWKRTAGGQFNGIAVDGSGNVYVGLNPGVAKYNSSGTRQWSVTVGDGVNGIAVSPSGNVYFSGISYGSNGALNALAGCISAAGQLLWTQSPDSFTPNSLATAVAVDSAGNAYVTGFIQDQFDSPSNAFVAEYNAAGNLLWNPQLGAPGSRTSTSGVVVDAAGNIYVSGVGPPFAGGPATYNSYLVKYNPADVVQWVDRFESEGIMRLRLGPNGTVMVNTDSAFVGFNSSGQQSFAIPIPVSSPDVTSELQDFAFNNGNLYDATAVFEPPLDLISGFLSDIVVPEPSAQLLLCVGGLFAARIAWRSRLKPTKGAK